MQKSLNIAIIVIFAALFASYARADGGADANKPLRLIDSLAINAAEGTLKKTAGDDRWLFLFVSDMNESPTFIPAGTTIGLLPCSTLEKLAADANDNPGSLYRIWGTIAVYRGQNFVFPTYFLPLSRGQDSSKEIIETAGAAEEKEAAINEPNDAITIPENVLSRMRTGKIIPIDTAAPLPSLAKDTVLADRSGFIISSNGSFVFTFDALGQNAQSGSLELLPCRTLELAQNRQAGSPERLRFRAAGIVTQYRGRQYLFLQRAATVYGHGNFAR